MRLFIHDLNTAGSNLISNTKPIEQARATLAKEVRMSTGKSSAALIMNTTKVISAMDKAMLKATLSMKSIDLSSDCRLSPSGKNTKLHMYPGRKKTNTAEPTTINKSIIDTS